MTTIPFLPEYFSQIKEHLENGYPVIFPTETCYGFSGDIFSESAIKRVEKIKKRNAKPFLVLASDFQEMGKYGNTKYINESWKEKAQENPISFLLQKTKNISEFYFPEFEEIGIRVPKYKPLIGFIKYFGSPLFSTSANISGQRQMYKEKEIQDVFGNYPYVLFATVGDLEVNEPSRIVRITEDKEEWLR